MTYPMTVLQWNCLPAGPCYATDDRKTLQYCLDRTHFNSPRAHGPDDSAFLAQLRLRFGDWLGTISLTGPRFAYPLSMVLADRYSDHRIALLGDAARGIHPIAGQGFNLGVRDIAALAEIVVDAHRTGLDIGQKTILQNYERWRYGDSMLIANVCHGLLKLFANSNPSLRFARRSGLGLVNQLPPLKNF